MSASSSVRAPAVGLELYGAALARVGTVLSSLLLKAYFLCRAGQYRFAQPRPQSPGRVSVDGHDPVRILIVGAGLASGYGVTQHDQTLAGSLAADVADATGRGVIIDIRANALLPANRAIKDIGPEGAFGYHAAVFTPCYLKAPFRPGAGMSRHGAAIQQHLLNTGGPDLQLLMIGIPRPRRYSRLNLAAARPPPSPTKPCANTHKTTHERTTSHPRTSRPSPSSAPSPSSTTHTSATTQPQHSCTHWIGLLNSAVTPAEGPPTATPKRRHRIPPMH